MIRYSWEITIKNSKVEREVASDLTETLRESIEADVQAARFVIKRLFSTKYEGFVVRVRAHVLKHEGKNPFDEQKYKKCRIATKPPLSIFTNQDE